MFSLKPIGFLRSPFTFKNGTPRQPTVCPLAKGIITIDKDVFNNPEHSLEGLDEFSHVWIFFIFHKNNNSHTKAKVKPPRLNGKKTGVFSTRSPYRPNNIGLTLAKIENITGACLTVSGIDILDGTPIIDIKPYISQYDCPVRGEPCQTVDVSEDCEDTCTNTGTAQYDMEACSGDSVDPNSDTQRNIDETMENKDSLILCLNSDIETDLNNIIPCDLIDKQVSVKADTKHDTMSTHCLPSPKSSKSSDEIVENDLSNFVDTACSQMCKADINSESTELAVGQTKVNNIKTEVVPIEQLEQGNDRNSSTAEWVAQAPVSKIRVLFTPNAEDQLKLFNPKSSHDGYRLQFLRSFDEAKTALVNILREDPRSTYRRKHCIDQLYYFTFDCIHVTCWFDNDFVEIVRVKPITEVEKLYGKLPISSE